MPDAEVIHRCLSAHTRPYDTKRSVIAGLTDPDGAYGKPTVYTEWESKTGLVLRDRRWPSRSGSYPDAEPCEHYLMRGEPR